MATFKQLGQEESLKCFRSGVWKDAQGRKIVMIHGTYNKSLLPGDVNKRFVPEEQAQAAIEWLNEYAVHDKRTEWIKMDPMWAFI